MRLGILGVLGVLLAATSCEAAGIRPPPAAEGDAAGFTLVEDWPKLPPGRSLGRVLGVTVDAEGRVWISHTDGPQIIALDPDTGAITAEVDARQFVSPHALTFDDHGSLWVTDDAQNRIVVLDRAGHTLRTLGAQ